MRGFRAVYLGLLFNCMIMATVNLAACKIAGDPVRPAALADAAVRRAAERRLRRALGPLGRAGHRHDPVLHQDDGRDRRRLLRAAGAAGRRPHAPGRQALRAEGPGRGQLPERPAGLHQQLGPGRGRLHHADRGAVVGGLVPRGGAGRRQLHRPAHAGLEVGEGRARRGAVLQHRPLRAAALALDPGRRSARSSSTRSSPTSRSLPEPRPEPARPRHRLSGDAEVPAGGLRRPDGGRADRRELLDDPDPSQLGRVVSGPRLLPALHQEERDRKALRARGPPRHVVLFIALLRARSTCWTPPRTPST